MAKVSSTTRQMIIGIGIDIVEKKRVEKVFLRHEGRFIKRILSEREQQKATKFNKERLIAFMTKRFSAKEAISKAIGCGIGSLLRWKDIEIENTTSGKPYVTINSRVLHAILTANPSLTKKKPQHQTIRQEKKSHEVMGQFIIHVSISDEKGNTVTQAVLELI